MCSFSGPGGFGGATEYSWVNRSQYFLCPGHCVQFRWTHRIFGGVRRIFRYLCHKDRITAKFLCPCRVWWSEQNIFIRIQGTVSLCAVSLDLEVLVERTVYSDVHWKITDFVFKFPLTNIPFPDKLQSLPPSNDRINNKFMRMNQTD